MIKNRSLIIKFIKKGIVVLTLLVTIFSCKKINLRIIGNVLGHNKEIWENRPEGIVCDATSATNASQNDISFDKDDLICVNISMDTDDFDVMRYESTFGSSVRSEKDRSTATATLFEYSYQCDVPWPSEYVWYRANIVIDGTQLNDIGIRKKGFFGSILSDAPSIKIKTSKYIANQAIGETANITLNNNSEDPTRIRNSISFKLFEMANYPTPRCNLANVSVNNEGLGVYTHLEPISDDFLIRNFGSNTGHLYEGQIADFVEDWLPRWQAKTDNTDELGSPILWLSNTVANASDEDLLERLGAHLNIDRFITFWALEVILEHIDGYTTNRNNFYIYFDPNDNGRATLIPWGMNYFTTEQGKNGDINAYLKAELPRRLSRIEETNTKFMVEVDRLLTEVWDVNALINLIDDYSELVRQGEVNSNYDNEIAALKKWVNQRESTVNRLLKDGLPEGKKRAAKRCLF